MLAFDAGLPQPNAICVTPVRGTAHNGRAIRGPRTPRNRGKVNLLQLPLHTACAPDVLARAVALSVQLRHHLFDTLYHAVALQTPGAVCVTADRRYLGKAHALGRIVWLGDYQHV